MAKKNKIAVNVREDEHIRISRRGNAAEVTHEILASWEIELFVRLLELHITRILIGKYGDGVCWDWQSRQDWREFLPLTGKANLTVHLPAGEDRKVIVRRIGDINIAVQEEEKRYSLR